MSVLHGLNIAGLAGGLLGAIVFDGQLTGPWRLALFAALFVLDVIMTVWITRAPAQPAPILPEMSNQPAMDDSDLADAEPEADAAQELPARRAA